jgi:hypothetical protein
MKTLDEQLADIRAENIGSLDIGVIDPLIAALKLAIEQRNSAIGGLIGDPHLTVESIEIDDKELQAILEGEK